MRIKLSKNNYLAKTQDIIKNTDFEKILEDNSITIEFIVGDKSKVTLREIIYLFQALKVKNRIYNSSFAVDKKAILEEDEFYFIVCNSKNKEDLVTDLKQISLNEVLK